jgi:hypothetical protein
MRMFKFSIAERNVALQATTAFLKKNQDNFLEKKSRLDRHLFSVISKISQGTEYFSPKEIAVLSGSVKTYLDSSDKQGLPVNLNSYLSMDAERIAAITKTDTCYSILGKTNSASSYYSYSEVAKTIELLRGCEFIGFTNNMFGDLQEIGFISESSRYFVTDLSSSLSVENFRFGYNDVSQAYLTDRFSIITDKLAAYDILSKSSEKFHDPQTVNFFIKILSTPKS